jgi:DNA-binding response OmpR family regulator
MPNAKVLVVEDEFVIALTLETVLRRGGYEVVGPAASVGQALRQLDAESPVAAVLDVNLGHETVFPVADALAERSVPFVFVTGYERPDLPAAHRDRPVLNKPCEARVLLARLAAVLNGGSERSG